MVTSGGLEHGAEDAEHAGARQFVAALARRRRDGSLSAVHVRAATRAVDADWPSTRSALFDAGRSSRVNVARFMADLLTGDDAWRRWKGQMPVIYDRAGSQPRAS